MRQSALALLSLAMLTAPLTAQGFEGTVTVKPNAEIQVPTKWMIKGSMIAMDGTMPPTSGPMAGNAMHIIIDEAALSMTVLVPLSADMSAMMAAMLPPGTKGLKIVTTLPKGTAGPPMAMPKKLGTTQTIAGMKCDDYEGAGPDGKPTRICVTRELGDFVYPSLGGRGGRGGSAPAWVAALRQIGGFPLKVWSVDGKSDFEVESVVRGSVPASAFAVPEGYNAMPGMGGRGGF